MVVCCLRDDETSTVKEDRKRVTEESAPLEFWREGPQPTLF